MRVRNIQPAILTGGSGTRLWPLSRQAYPKQFLNLFAGPSLFQQTCIRVSDPPFLSPMVLSNEGHRFIVAEQLQQVGIRPAEIVLEPVGRNTAPAALIAALMAAREDEDRPVLLLPSDQMIADTEVFAAAVSKGITAAGDGKIITFGIKPDSPCTGYGYIETKNEAGELLDVVRFVEKPTYEKAERYTRSPNTFWNTGIFLFSAGRLINAYEDLQRAILESCVEALDGAQKDLDFLRLDAEAYAQCEDISFDCAIMEKTCNIGCVPLKTGWSDLGSWSAVAEQKPRDENDNASQGDVMFHNSQNCYGHCAEGASLTINGLENVIAVATKDAILVTSKSGAQDIKDIVELRKARNSNCVTYHTRVYRPWGWYEGLEQGNRFRVKCLMVKPGERLSLQSHHHRAEHWVVVSGTAKVTVGEDTFLLTENESAYIAIGATHRLENPGRIPALLVEVQSGSYLGEDDIVRYEDIYDRKEDIEIT